MQEVSEAARALALRCEARVNELARRMTRDSFARLPGYDRLPDEMKDVEIAATVRHGVRLFLRSALAPEAREAGDMRLFRERAAQRAEEGMPLHLLLRSHSLGAHMLWRALREAALPGEEAALVELADLLFASQPGIVGAVAETYLDERSALETERRAQRRSLLRGLLDGTLPPARLAAAPFGLDGPCLVLAVGAVAPPDEGEVAARRRLRRVQTALDHSFGAEVPALIDTGTEPGRALVPGAAEPPEDLAERLSRAAGTTLRVAVVPAGGPEEVPEASRTAGEVLRVAAGCGLPPGLHRLDDVLLEYHLSRPGESGRRIAALLDPVAGRPELLETLRVHLAHGQDRRATAAALGLHPNTVDNRLARTAERTGIDLATPRGTATALAALLLREAPEA
ncbi:PucR family transcriptional regulator [Streptomyces tanashiensis]|uniref:Helix-turn-helix domain-containing protein n=1 Tax=Streptomyces tanashiensis TaxID=67367 RepID=A0ABY6QVS8_9ACTN|nr:helix-turn-helix domain-containing protein [Streptomyces tanashiensis]UZX21325.1 helix-turn-helix domain-containing protein [Streptomyces tanashiensis]GGY50693.1 transcriptional regulator [Streptomyces tanashiensis]